VAKNKNKKPGRFKQLMRVYRQTIKSDPTSLWLALLGLLLSVGGGIGLGLLTSGGSAFIATMWIISGSLTGVLIAMLVLSKRAERSAYISIEGQAGAVGAVLDSQIKRKWRAKSTPVAVNAKSREAIYRMIGPAGVVLIADGASPRTKQMLTDEGRKVERAVPGVKIHKVNVSIDNGVRLYALLKTVYKLPKSLNRREVTMVVNRLDALAGAGGLPIPKGIDPMRVRAPKRKG
jgi:cellobiose-specific phosphotransferase system component IIB